MTAAFALPILAVPARAGAIETNGEVGLTLLGYKERGLMKVTEPIVWGRAEIAEVWEVRASAAVDIVTGASPELVTNLSGEPVQSITAATISDRRTTWDIKVTRRIGAFSVGASRTVSDENDYKSHAYGLEAKLDLNDRNTTLVIAHGRSNDRVGSTRDPSLDERRDTREYLAGFTQVLSPLAILQSTVQWSHGTGWYNDPYKLTASFYPDGAPVVVADTRPAERDTFAWLTRLRHHFPQAGGGTLQADYRYYRDDWHIRSHTLDLAWHHPIDERWSVRPGLRYYTQSQAFFYAPVVPRPQPELQSSDQRLAAFGGLSPSLRVSVRLDNGLLIEGTAGYVHNASNLRIGGSGSPAFETLRAFYGIIDVSKAF